MKAIENLIGKRVIIRAQGAGVFYGTLNEVDGNTVELVNCRRLWYWDGAASLSQLAAEGVKAPQNCKFTVTVESIVILNVIEIIPATAEAQESIDNVKVWKK